MKIISFDSCTDIDCCCKQSEGVCSLGFHDVCAKESVGLESLVTWCEALPVLLASVFCGPVLSLKQFHTTLKARVEQADSKGWIV